MDEDEAQRAHKKVYEEGDTKGLSASSLGSAAALQVCETLYHSAHGVYARDCADLEEVYIWR